MISEVLEGRATRVKTRLFSWKNSFGKGFTQAVSLSSASRKGRDIDLRSEWLSAKGVMSRTISGLFPGSPLELGQGQSAFFADWGSKPLTRRRGKYAWIWLWVRHFAPTAISTCGDNTRVMRYAFPGYGMLRVIGLTSLTDCDINSVSDTALEKIRLGNSTARSLPQLVTLARGESGRVVFDYMHDAHLTVTVTPC